MTSRRTRQRMIDRLRQQGISSEAVLLAMRDTPRHTLVDEALASRSYEDTALPIGYGQTISQPYIVAKMTELLLEASPRCVLEIGTGCGYQTALLAQLTDYVYSIERIAPLLKKAKNYLWDLGCKNISLHHGDGACGLAQHAPFDAILVAAAASSAPPILLEQMAVGAVMLIPIGFDAQQLHKITRTADGYETETIAAVVFVPLLAGVC